MKQTILLVEDDPEILKLIRLHLEAQGYTVLWEQNGKDGLSRALSENPDLCILDIELPLMNGLEMCSELRAQGRTFPILMLTSRREESDRVLGLQVGADDYVCKPFGVLELMARIEAMLRRANKYSPGSSAEATQEIIRYGQIEIDLHKHQAQRDGKPLNLTLLEFDLLLMFATNPGRIFTREELLRDVWNYSHDGYINTVNTHITRLRKKIEYDPSDPKFVRTVWGIGYRGSEEEEFESE